MGTKRKGIYYLGRVIKDGRLDGNLLIKSVLQPKAIHKGKHDWTIIESKELKVNGERCVYGKLSKFAPDAVLKFVIPDQYAEEERREPNLSIAVSPFVYIPSQSGIAFLHEARHIPHWIFADRFCEIIENTNDYFWVGCDIETIADLRTFATKLRSLEGIIGISASVKPPNPLFGPLWESLKTHMETRKVGSLEIKEEARGEEMIDTQLPELVSLVSEQTPENQIVPKTALPIAESAILMAADGYGHGYIEGVQAGKLVVIRTSESIKNFTFDRDPDPEELATRVTEILSAIEIDRNLRH